MCVYVYVYVLTAQNTLRELLMDGQYGQICFIATQSDVFQRSDIKRRCACILTCMHACMHSYIIHIFIATNDVFQRMYACMHVYLRYQAEAYVHTHTHAYIHTYIPSYLRHVFRGTFT
jgi:hypothetical protein